MAREYKDTCDLCGSDPARCRNIYCSANTKYMGPPIIVRPKQGPGKPGAKTLRRQKKAAAMRQRMERTEPRRSWWMEARR